MKKKIFRWHPRKILICSLSPYPYPHCNVRLEFPKLDGAVFRKGFFTGFVWFLQIDLNFFERENTHLETGFVFCRRCPLLSIFQKSHTAIFYFTSIRPLVSELAQDWIVWFGYVNGCDWKLARSSQPISRKAVTHRDLFCLASIMITLDLLLQLTVHESECCIRVMYPSS